MSEECFKKLQQIIKEIKPSVESVNKDSDLGKDLAFDSLDTINFLFEVEKVFNIKIPESDISENELVKINKIMKYIEKRVNNN